MDWPPLIRHFILTVISTTFGRSDIHASEMTGYGCYINFNRIAFFLVSLEHLIYSIYSFEIGVDGDWLSLKIMVFDFRWTGEATTSRVAVKGFPRMTLYKLMQGTTRNWELMEWMLSLLLQISLIRCTLTDGLSCYWAFVIRSLHMTASFLFQGLSSQIAHSTWNHPSYLRQIDFGRH